MELFFFQVNFLAGVNLDLIIINLDMALRVSYIVIDIILVDVYTHIFVSSPKKYYICFLLL